MATASRTTTLVLAAILALALAACQTTTDGSGRAAGAKAGLKGVPNSELSRITEQIGRGCSLSVSLGGYQRPATQMRDLDIRSVRRGENDVDQVTFSFRGRTFAAYFFRSTLAGCNRDELEAQGLEFVPKAKG